MKLEPRIKSRLNPKIIAFKPYLVKELVDILRDRAMRALHPDSWNAKTLERIAEKAKGDARIAIQTLRNAAFYAENESANKILAGHIKKGFSDTEDLENTYQLKRLTQHHTLLYRIVMEHQGKISTYQERCKIPG